MRSDAVVTSSVAIDEVGSVDAGIVGQSFSVASLVPSLPTINSPSKVGPSVSSPAQEYTEEQEGQETGEVQMADQGGQDVVSMGQEGRDVESPGPGGLGIESEVLPPAARRARYELADLTLLRGVT